jgi:phage-related protein
MSGEGRKDEAVKPLFWVGSSLHDMRDFPEEVRRTMGFALWQAQQGGKHLDAKVLQGFGGAGLLEVIEDHHGGTFRGVYTVKFAGAVYSLHSFQKKSKKGVKTPASDMNLIRQRLKAAEKHYKEWRLSQEKEAKE